MARTSSSVLLALSQSAEVVLSSLPLYPSQTSRLDFWRFNRVSKLASAFDSSSSLFLLISEALGTSNTMGEEMVSFGASGFVSLAISRYDMPFPEGGADWAFQICWKAFTPSGFQDWITTPLASLAESAGNSSRRISETPISSATLNSICGRSPGGRLLLPLGETTSMLGGLSPALEMAISSSSLKPEESMPFNKMFGPSVMVTSAIHTLGLSPVLNRATSLTAPKTMMFFMATLVTAMI